MPIRRALIRAFSGWLGALTVANAFAGEDIAVLSRDARFVVLSADMLAERDVGNLWWLGIRGSRIATTCTSRTSPTASFALP
jgi:hypothetical protein